MKVQLKLKVVSLAEPSCKWSDVSCPIPLLKKKKREEGRSRALHFWLVAIECAVVLLSPSQTAQWCIFEWNALCGTRATSDPQNICNGDIYCCECAPWVHWTWQQITRKAVPKVNLNQASTGFLSPEITVFLPLIAANSCLNLWK